MIDIGGISPANLHDQQLGSAAAGQVIRVGQ